MTNDADDNREVERDESIAGLEGGGLPLQAQRRLQQETSARAPFVSDLSVNEFLLTRQAGYEPVGQVMGSSIFHVGWQYTQMQSGELAVLSQAHLRARELALGRMQQEAAALGAHGVVGVDLRAEARDWGADVLEFTAMGTAVRLVGGTAGKQPFLSDLSGEEFWTLLRAGYLPVGLVMGFCSYFVYASPGMYSWQNVELTWFTEGVYRARRFALQRLTAQAHALGADGCVGVHLDVQKQVYRTSDNDPPHLKVDFLAVGTAVRREAALSAVQAPQPMAVVLLGGLETRRSRSAAEGQDEELGGEA